MRVLGIDPGSRVTGFGVIDANGSELRHIQSDSIRLPSVDLSARLKMIHQRLCEVIADCNPQVMAVEKVFLARNAQSALVLGQARGAAIVAGAHNDLEVVEYSALQIKQAVVGKGKAGKQQVQHMVRMLLGLAQQPANDAADALACAICHIHTAQGTRRLQGAMQRSGVAL